MVLGRFGGCFENRKGAGSGAPGRSRLLSRRRDHDLGEAAFHSGILRGHRALPSRRVGYDCGARHPVRGLAGLCGMPRRPGGDEEQLVHRTVSCETCHGAASEHAREEADDDPVLPTGRELCLACHRYLASRPTGFPQIIEERHEPAKLCHTCHDPHDPVPSERPESCSGCHAAISRVKAVSHHEPLDCEVCHEAEPEHFLSPRSHLPRKPFERAFCGNCHARDVDLPTHFRGVDLGERDIPQDRSGHARWNIVVLAMPLPALPGGSLDAEDLRAKRISS